MNKICVVGLGYIGFPTALMFAKSGLQVVGVDINEKIVNMLNEGKIHIEEKGLQEVYASVLESRFFTAQTEPEQADVFIIAVPTPITEVRKSDVSYVEAAIKAILPHLRKGNVVIVESTIPPRTIDDLVAPLIASAGWSMETDIFLAHCPERVLPGNIFKEMVENSRIIGGYNMAAAHKAASVYSIFVKGEIVLTTATSAEMAKLMENTYRDVNIALANELSMICASIGVDALEVIKLANKHPRVHLHSPGPGVGGHCIAVDPYFVIEKSPKLARLMSTAREINHSMPHYVLQQVERLCGAPGDKTIAIFGITYKGNVDDTRESPAMEVISLLTNKGYRVQIHDPHVRQENTPLLLTTSEEALKNADCLLILADHQEFKHLDEEKVFRLMKTPVVFDTKNCLNPNAYKKIKIFNYGNLYELVRGYDLFNREIAVTKKG